MLFRSICNPVWSLAITQGYILSKSVQNNQLIKFSHVIIHINHITEVNLEPNQRQIQIRIIIPIKNFNPNINQQKLYTETVRLKVPQIWLRLANSISSSLDFVRLQWFSKRKIDNRIPSTKIPNFKLVLKEGFLFSLFDWMNSQPISVIPHPN